MTLGVFRLQFEPFPYYILDVLAWNSFHSLLAPSSRADLGSPEWLS